ncbi:MAG: cyclic nucleotide-binding domain-containing protein [Desulfobacterales bacterium]|nr:cyclic nucleotide-binding domain-containing protein [Desulfobacterales bacterium]MCP4159007.1 cyclic nucleotide-binding domain-containing protein [Deltaproteobacteria bacterium]
MPKEIKSNLISEDTIDLISKFQILVELDKDEIKSILGEEGSDYQRNIAKLMKFKEREIVINEGDFDSWVFWIVKGEFAVVKENVIITYFTIPGEVFGEMSILDADQRSASVIAKTEGVCLCIDMSILDNIKNDEITDKIKKGIQNIKNERLNNTTKKLVSEKQKITEQKQELENERKRLKDIEVMLNEKIQSLFDKEVKLTNWEKKLEDKEKKFPEGDEQNEVEDVEVESESSEKKGDIELDQIDVVDKNDGEGEETIDLD